MKPSTPSKGGLVVRIPAALALVSSLSAVPITWDNSNATGAWSTGANWDTNVEPTAADDVTFPLGLAGTITTTTTENALSLTFNDAYTLSGGTLALASGNSISVADGVSATINNALTITGGLSKTGTGTLVLTAANTNAGGTVVSQGKLRVSGNASALGAAAVVTTVNGAATLEVAGGYTLDRPVTLMHGGTVAGLGASFNNGKITIDAAATSVTLATDQASDVFSVGNGANDITGGTAATVIGLSGPGAVRLGGASDFDGSWTVATGRLELGAAAALGDQAGSSVTLAGGTLSPRLATATTFTGPAGNLLVTADSAILSDRSSVSAGVIHTLGTLSMGSNSLTVAPGASATSGTAAIVLGNVTLTGNPTFAVNDVGATNGKLTTGSLLGGGIARTIVKSGGGDLAVTGGSSDLPSGSTFSATGGGVVELLFPNLGVAAAVAISAAQNPFGTSSIQMVDGSLRLLADGSGTAAVQTYQLPVAITLGGAVTLDPDRRSGSNSAKTFELPGLSLAAGTVLDVAGDNTHGLRLTGGLALQGNATIQGSSATSKDGLLTLNGGILGSAGTVLSIAGGTSPLNLTVNASSTYGGGTLMSGGNVTLNAAAALGSGPLTLNGGTLTVNADDALSGVVSLNGGTLRVNDLDAIDGNPVHLNGGTLDLRNNTSASYVTGTLTVSGNSTLGLGNNGSGSSQTLVVPELNVSGATTLTYAPLNSYVANIAAFDLAGDLTFNHIGTARIQSITEDTSPRVFLKGGTGTTELEGASFHSGGTEVLAGILLVEHAAALGGGELRLGATSGNAAATVDFGAGLNIVNDFIVRGGSSGLMTLDLSAGGVVLGGDGELEKSVTLFSNSGTMSSLTGVLGGAGDIDKTSSGTVFLGNAANSFGSGTAASVNISDGILAVANDGALGAPGNGVTMAGTDGTLRIDASFNSSRTFTVASTGTSTGIQVADAQELGLNGSLAGTGTFTKSGLGTLTLAAGVDSSARGAAAVSMAGGILRVQGVNNLSASGPIALNNNTSSGTVDFLRDANTTFPYPVLADGIGTIHVDRAIGGSATNGRHTLGTLGMNTGSLTVTGANGYGLSFGAATFASNNTVTNNAPGALVLASMTGNPGSSNLTMTLGGTGDIEITGAISEGAGTGNYGITKTGPGSVRFGSAVSEFGRVTTINDGTLDLNGLVHPVSALNFGGAASASGATLVTGASGSLELGGNVFFDSITSGQAGALFNGNLGLGAASRQFDIENNAVAADLTINGPIGGGPGAAISKVGTGTLRLAGAGNTQPGLVTVTAGTLELAKSSGDAVGSGGLSVFTNGAVVRLAANEQINNAASVAVGNSGFLELDGFTETTGPVTFTQTTPNQYNAIKTGAAGTLVLGGNLVFNNNTNTLATTSERNLLITGSGTKSVSTTTGTLDLGGATRSIHVATNGPSVNANATIETQIINGGILKTGPRTLFLNHPNNIFAGGLQIAEGTVKPAAAGSLGLGTVSFTNAPGTAAGIDFGSLTGTVPGTINTGTGDFTFTYSAPAPNVLTLAGGFDLQQDLAVNVVNGSVQNGSPTEVFRAVVDVTGTIDDAAGTFGLTKTGDGMLKLAAGNTYGGATVVERGILSLAVDSSLGDTTAPLTLEGGCLGASNSFTLTRDLVIGAGGGSLRADFSRTMEIAGPLDWGSATTGTDGSGRIVISGPTTGSGNLKIGESIAFAAGTVGQQLTWNVDVCLQGPAAVPSGNLSFGGYGVLELGNGDFTRPLGTGPGEVQMPTNVGGGWAAVGADRVVNIGGASAPLIWGQTSPPFFYKDGPSTGDFGHIVLGSFNATHTVEFQNPLVFPPAAGFITGRGITSWDGAAAVDARVTGDISQMDPDKLGDLNTTGNGTLEITGDLLGHMKVDQDGEGTTILSGNNSGLKDVSVFVGNLRFANQASVGVLESIFVAPSELGSVLDATALPSPLTLAQDGQIWVDGQLAGDVLVNGGLLGFGEVTGDVTVPAGSFVYPQYFGMLHIGGDLTAQDASLLEFEFYGLVPEEDFNRMRVTGAVNLDGSLYFYGGFGLLENDSAVLILNDGTDPINGTFDGLPEGAAIPIGDGLALQVSYLANGDGGAVGNDFGVTVVPDVSTDLSLVADAPVAVDLGVPIVINYTVENFGPNPMSSGELQVTLPGNATFASSIPAGTQLGNVVHIPIPALGVFATTSVQLQLAAPGTIGSVFVESVVSGSGGDLYNFNNSAPSMTAVLVGGVPLLSSLSVDTVNDEMTLGIDALQGVRYLLEGSIELGNWYDLEEFIGNGEIYDIIRPMDEDKEFFRFRILPYSNGGGGGGE